MSSSRYPGKMLASVAGMPLIELILRRLSKSTHVGGLLVVTSDEPSDDVLAVTVQDLGFPVFRGPLLNVAERFHQAIVSHGIQAFARVCGDSPWYDPLLLDQAIKVHQQMPAAVTTNKLHQSFPPGLSIEIFDAETFCSAIPSLRTAYQIEHVTPYFYENHRQFRINSITAASPTVRFTNLCIDTPEDLQRISGLFAQFNDPTQASAAALFPAGSLTFQVTSLDPQASLHPTQSPPRKDGEML